MKRGPVGKGRLPRKGIAVSLPESTSRSRGGSETTGLLDYRGTSQIGETLDRVTLDSELGPDNVVTDVAPQPFGVSVFGFQDSHEPVLITRPAVALPYTLAFNAHQEGVLQLT
jgi:hypothetical protein